MAMTDSDASAIVGLFDDQAKAEQAVNELRAAGFTDDQISMEVRSTNVTNEDSTAVEQSTEALEENTAEATPGTLLRKTEVSRTVVTVKAGGREQEALGILHRNGADNANIPDALEAELAPILGAEMGETGRPPEQAPDPFAKEGFFGGTPEAPGRPGDPAKP